MTLQQRIGRSVVRRNRKLLKRLPSLEIIEPRVLSAVSPGFVQGFDLNGSNVGIPNATVTLTNTSNNQSISTLTNGVGYYAFNGVAPGTYDVTQTAANYVQSGVNIQTTVNPASALPDNGGIQVTVLNLGVPQPITATWATNPYSPGSYQNTNISINAPGFQTPAEETYDGQLTGQLGVTLSGNQGNVTSILSLCTDLVEGIDIPPPASSFTAQPGLAPAPGTSAASALQTNIGEIGYLYNTYGQSLQGATPAAQAINGAAVQLALWALLYNDVAYPTSVNGDPSVTNGQNFQVLSSTNPAIVNQANTYLADAAANSPEDAYILNVAKGTSRGGQAMISTDLLNFTNTQLFQPSINTAASVSTPNTVGVATLQDVATLSGGDSPTGMITFTLTQPDGTTIPEGSVPVNGDGSYTSPTSVLATEVGTYTWHATYGGDTNNKGASDNGANEGVTTVQASPSITTMASVSTPNTVGVATLQDVATLSGGDSPTGMITFTLTQPDGTTIPEGSVSVNGDGSYTSPTSVLATEVGTYTWHATYGGDTNNKGASDNGANEGVTTVQASPSITTMASVSTPNTVGVATLQDVATLSGGDSPTGMITFTLTQPDGTTIPEGSVSVNGDGSYTSPTSVLATEVGTYTWHATYGGDTNNKGVSDNGANEGVTTVQASPSITTMASVSTPNTVGVATLQDVATLSGGDSPTGMITFTLTQPDGTTIPEGSVPVNGDGSYTSPTSVLATEVGTYTWHATYGGDTNNKGASDNGANEGVTTVQASPSITTMASVSTPNTVGVATLQDVATLSGGDSPTGMITFTLTRPDGTTIPEGSVSVNGDGSYTSPTSVLATEVGTYTWHATYGGDTNNKGASDNGANEGVTTVQASPSITTMASVSTPNTVGVATLQDVATLSGGDSPTGMITFTLTQPDGTTIPEGSVSVNGDGSYTSPTSVLATEVGTYTWHATYGGDTNNKGASDNGANEGVTTVQASPSITTMASVSTPNTVGVATLQDVATLSGGDSPTGMITFTLTQPDGTTIPEGSVSVNGDGSYTSPTSVLATEVGTYTWHATYGGDTNNKGASDNGANEGVTTVQASPSITTMASVSTPNTVGVATLQDVATLSGGDSPTGMITFTLTQPDGTTIPEGSVSVNGDGSYTSPTSVLATEVGTYTWHATYGGDTNNKGASDNGANEGVTTVQASPSITTMASVSTPNTVGVATLQDVATLSGGDSPTGMITFTLTQPDGTTIPEGSVSVNGDGSYTSPTSVLATEVGTYTWHARYSGDTLNAAANDTGANEGVVTKKSSPSIGTTASGTANDVVGVSYLSDSAVLSGGYNETGNITFTLKAPNGSTQTETVTVNGPKTYTTPTPVLATQVGTYTWSASYAGDGLNNGTIDNGKNETVCIVASSPSIVTTPNPTVVTIGTSCGPLTDSATLSGGSNPGGSITFTLYAPGCKTPVDTETVSVNGDKTYTTPKGYTLPSNPTPGVYQWDATYSGDSKNAMATDAGNTWEQVQVVTPCCNVSNISFTVNDNGTITHPTDLGGNTQQGDTVIANFTVPAGYYDELTLVTYTAPESSYNADDAGQQVVSQVATGFFGPGAHTLGPVTIPGSFYQIDFVCGSVITTLGPAGSNNFYSAQNRLISHDNGGVNPVGLPELEIQGTVFFDSNDNGVEGSGDSGLANVTVNLTGTDDYGNSVSISTQTNSSGAYTFAGMPISNSAGYTVTPVVPSGYTAGIATAGKVNGTTVDGTASSSPESVGGVLMQTSSQTNGTGYNFGMVKPISLSGEVYTDINGDGKLESGDTGLNGVTITLYNSSGKQVTSTTTSGSGSSAGGYSFNNLAPGTYSVVETILNNYLGTGSDVGSVGGTSVSATNIGSITLAAGQSGVSYNFGEAQPVCISGKVFTDSSNNCNSSQSGLNGVTITLENSSGKVVASTVTSGYGSSAGSYSFTNLAPGTYTLVETVLSGYSATGTDIGSAGASSSSSTQISGISLSSGSSASGYDFGQKKKS